MENNIVEKKEGIYYYFKTLFGNTNREKDIDEIIYLEFFPKNMKYQTNLLN